MFRRLILAFAIIAAPACAQLSAPTFGGISLPLTTTPKIDTSLGNTTPGNVIKLVPGNGLNYCPELSCVPRSADADHRRASVLISGVTQLDAQAEEDFLGVHSVNNKGFVTDLSRSTPYQVGDNAVIGNAAYRATTAGTTAAGNPPPGTRPSSEPFFYQDGGVRWKWVNDAAVVAKVGFYNEFIDQAGGGASWAQANNHELRSGFKPRFVVNTEFDLTNNSGTDCITGVPSCQNLYISNAGSNRLTFGINLNAGGAGTIFGLRATGKFEQGLSIDTQGNEAITIGALTPSTLSVAVINDKATAPVGYNATGNKSLAAFRVGARTPIGIDFRDGTYVGSDGSAGLQMLGPGWQVNASGDYIVRSLSCSATPCGSGSGGGGSYPTSPTFTSATFSGSPTNSIDISSATPGTNQIKGTGFTVDKTGGGGFTGINTSGNLGVAGLTIMSRLNVNLGLADPGAGNIGLSGKITVGAARGVIESTKFTPTSSTAACTVGEHAWDATYEYRCVAANTWQRSARSSASF